MSILDYFYHLMLHSCVGNQYMYRKQGLTTYYPMIDVLGTIRGTPKFRVCSCKINKISLQDLKRGIL